MHELTIAKIDIDYTNYYKNKIIGLFVVTCLMAHVLVSLILFLCFACLGPGLREFFYFDVIELRIRHVELNSKIRFIPLRCTSMAKVKKYLFPFPFDNVAKIKTLNYLLYFFF